MSPKGRGSNQRRRTRRQRVANWTSRLPATHSYAVNYDEARKRRMRGKFKPRTRGVHPLERRP